MRALLVVIALVGGCAAPRSGSRAPARAVVPQPDHPDWAHLKVMRNYLRLVEVGPFAHHFTVWYHDVEPCVCEATVEGAQVTLRDCWFGGMGVPPAQVPALPRELQPLGDKVWARVQERERGARAPIVKYNGEYRAVTFAEDIRLSEEYAAGLVAMLTLASDAELTRFTRVIGSTSGIGALCGLPGDAACSATPRWIRFATPARGRSVLDRYRVELERRQRRRRCAAGGLLGEARRAPAQAAALPLDALEVGDTLLPEGLEQRVQAVFEVWAMRANRGGAAETRTLSLPFDARDVARGDAHAEAHVEVAGRGFDVTMAMRGEPAKQSGKAKREVTIRVRDSEGHAFGWIYPATAYLSVDSERAAAMSVLMEFPRSSSGPLRPEQDLPGAKDVEKFLVHVNPELQPVWRQEP